MDDEAVVEYKRIALELLTQVKSLIEDNQPSDALLDEAEHSLNAVARIYRTMRKPNKSVKYRLVSSMVAQARILWNTKNRHMALPDFMGE